MSSPPSPSAEPLLQQAAAIPYPRRQGPLEFCLITSAQKSHWAFPKGTIDPGETWEQTALKEAHEEAGLRGTIEANPLGSYAYAKWDRQFQVTVCLMRVTEALDAWPESAARGRRWANAEEALALIDRAELRHFLTLAAERLREVGSA